MREMERPVAGGCPDGSNGAGSRRAPASLHELFRRAERASSTQGAIGRAAAAGGSRSGAVDGFPGASASRGGGRRRGEARAAVACLGAGWSDGGDSRGARNWRDVLPQNRENGSGGGTCRRADAGGVASAQRCSAGESGAGDFAEDAETRRVVSACPRQDAPEGKRGGINESGNSLYLRGICVRGGSSPRPAARSRSHRAEFFCSGTGDPASGSDCAKRRAKRLFQDGNPRRAVEIHGVAMETPGRNGEAGYPDQTAARRRAAGSRAGGKSRSE